MTKLLTSVLAFATALAWAGPASAATILGDDLNDDSGVLAGETASTGQTWGAFSLFGPIAGDLTADTAYGTGATNGAGATSFSSNQLNGNTISLGQTLSTGTFRLEMDMVTGQNTSFSYTQFWLSGGGGNASLQWTQGAVTGIPYTTFEGLGITDVFHDVNYGNGVLHVTLDMDLDAKSIHYSWYNAGDPENPLYRGSVDLAYSADFAPEVLHVVVHSQAGGARGVDNIVLQSPIPPPTVPGDFDSDGDVDGADFVVWQTNFPTASDATLADGDADGDGDVDGADFVVWQTNFPFTPSPAVAPVPEPQALLLAILGGLGIAVVRCHRRCLMPSVNRPPSAM